MCSSTLSQGICQVDTCSSHCETLVIFNLAGIEHLLLWNFYPFSTILFIYYRSKRAEEQMKCTYTPSFYSHASCGFVSLLAITSHRFFTHLKKEQGMGKKVTCYCCLLSPTFKKMLTEAKSICFVFLESQWQSTLFHSVTCLFANFCEFYFCLR